LVSGLSLLFSIAYLIAEHFNLSSSFR